MVRTAATADKVLDALRSDAKDLDLEIDGHPLHLSSLDKVLFPGPNGRAITKRGLLEYLVEVHEPMLRHLRDRPVTLVRMPSGLKGQRFYQRHQEGKLPGFLQTVEIYTPDRDGPQRYLLINDLSSLLWLGQMNTMEIHAWYSRTDPMPENLPTDFDSSETSVEKSALEYPDYMVFDLDPSVPGGKRLTKEAFDRVRRTAEALHEDLDALGLEGWLKTSGKSGIHVLIPIAREYSYDRVRALAESIGKRIVERLPKLTTMEREIDDRGSRVYIDYSQNARGKSLAAVYSPRAAQGAPVSYPIQWKDLDTVYPTDFTIHNVPDLLKRGDPWAAILTKRQELPEF
jgi:bifunctional non-homologous end joining protein LigD